MHLLNKLIILFSLSMLLVLPPAKTRASEIISSRAITEQQWQQLTQDSAFNYKNKKETVTKPVESNNRWYKFINHILSFFNSSLGMFIFWGVFILLLAYAAYTILTNERFALFKRDKKKVTTDDTQIEEDISLTNWEERMQQAIKTNDFRHAVRYSYMWLLQLLQNKELILYRNDKTNYDYYNELVETPYKQPFKQLSRQYEYAWYGHFALPENTFNDYMQLFNNVKKQLI